eukprot:111370-Amphidinium_carterae.1
MPKVLWVVHSPPTRPQYGFEQPWPSWVIPKQRTGGWAPTVARPLSKVGCHVGGCLHLPGGPWDII